MITFLLANWQKLLLGMIVLILGMWIGTLHLKLGIAKGEVAELTGYNSKLESELVVWQNTYAVLTEEVSKQNQAVKIWQDKAKTASIKAAESLEKAKAISSASHAEISRLKASIKAGGDSCSQAIKDIRNGRND